MSERLLYIAVVRLIVLIHVLLLSHFVSVVQTVDFIVLKILLTFLYYYNS